MDFISKFRHKDDKKEYKVRWKNCGPSDDSWEPAKGLKAAKDCVRNYWDKRRTDKLKKKKKKKKAVQSNTSRVRSKPKDMAKNMSSVSAITHAPITVSVAALVDIVPDHADEIVKQKVGVFSVVDAKKALKSSIKEDASEDSMVFCSELYQRLALTQFKTKELSVCLERNLGVKIGRAMKQAFIRIGPAKRTGTRVSRPYAFHGVSFISD